MFWRIRRIRLFKRQYFVAISLFSSVELAPKAHVDYRHPNYPFATYAIKCGDKQLGWVHVRPFASATAYWNEQMREKRNTLAVWQNGRLFTDWSDDRPPPDPKSLDDVQLTVVYETHTKYEREAANDAWTKLLAGHPAYIEWYDASLERNWTKFFRPNRPPPSYYEKS